MIYLIKILLNETTEPIYDYIVEKIYQMPEYKEDVYMNKQKLKIAFNKFYEKPQHTYRIIILQ